MSYDAALPADLIDEIHGEGNHRPERRIMVQVSEAHIHCSEHTSLMRTIDNSIDWGTDSDVAKRTEFFQLGEMSLYDRVGGHEAMDVFLDRFSRKVLMDISVRQFFNDTNMVLQLQKQRDLLKLALGGVGSNHSYTADNLRQAHQHLLAKGMNDAHFDQL